jgi:hypothetical protein
MFGGCGNCAHLEEIVDYGGSGSALQKPLIAEVAKNGHERREERRGFGYEVFALKAATTGE